MPSQTELESTEILNIYVISAKTTTNILAVVVRYVT